MELATGNLIKRRRLAESTHLSDHREVKHINFALLQENATCSTLRRVLRKELDREGCAPLELAQELELHCEKEREFGKTIGRRASGGVRLDGQDACEYYVFGAFVGFFEC